MINSIRITEKDKDNIIYNLLSERYAELKSETDTRDEAVFQKIEYLYNFYKRKIEYYDIKRYPPAKINRVLI